MIDWTSGSRRGFLHRTAGALVLSAALAVLFVAPDISAQSDNAPLYSQWYGAPSADALDLLLDEEIAAAPADSADFNVGSFSLHRPQSELFINGLIGDWYDAAAAAAISGDTVEAYLQARARAQLTAGGQVPDFKTWLSARGYDLGDRLLSGGANYLTAAAAAGAQDLRFVRTVEWDYQTSLGERPWQSGFSALGALRERADDAVAWQLRGYVAEDSVVGANAGVIYRRAAAFAGGGLVGANVFLDYERSDDYREHFWRWSVGGEYRNAYVDVYLNRYFAITDDAEQNDGGYVYTQGGQEAHLNVKAPDFGVGQVSGGLTYYLWEGEYGAGDDEGLRYHLGFSPRRGGFKLQVELDSPDSGGTDWGGRLSYRHVVGAADKGNAADAAAVFDARSGFFEVTRREYAQRLRRSAPAAEEEPETPEPPPAMDTDPVYNHLYLLGGRRNAPPSTQIAEVWASDAMGTDWRVISLSEDSDHSRAADSLSPDASVPLETDGFPPRSEHAAAVLNDMIFFSGGVAPMTVNDVVSTVAPNDVWSSADGVVWNRLVSDFAGGARQNHAMISYDGALYIIGGLSGGATPAALNDVWRSTDGVMWTRTNSSAFNSGRHSFAIAVYNDEVYVIGGSTAADGGSVVNEIYKASEDLSNFSAVTGDTLPLARSNAQAVSYNNRMYLIGGEVEGAGANSDVWSSADGAIWRQDTAAPAFTSPTAENLTNHTAYANATAMFVVGGQDTGQIETPRVYSSTDGANWVLVSDTPGFGGRINSAGVLFNPPPAAPATP